MRSIGARLLLLPLSLAAFALADWNAQAEERLEGIYDRYAPMFRYWCLSAEQRYVKERRTTGHVTAEHDRTEVCERLAAIYVGQLRTLALADGEASDERVIDTAQFIGQACIDMQMIGTGRARAEGSCPIAARREDDRGARIEQVFGPYALQNDRWEFERLGRQHLLALFPPGSRASALTDYLKAHGYRCRADRTRIVTQYSCHADYAELIYERFHASMIGGSVSSVTYHARADGRLDDIVVDRFDEGLAIFGPYPE